ncbi:hypothetical protein DV736_g4606, partial [Chaetothyriales sp. CBS 134916]
MRYQNWDVLLFPGTSRVPMQEFDTRFHVLTLTGKPSTPRSIGHLFMDGRYESLTKLPLLTCFITSQLENRPFRVSIHSWAPPSPSSILLAHKAKHETVAFQARVHIDGVHQCSRTFTDAVSWPEVFDHCDSNATRPSSELQFPSFHPELLQQASWDAAEHRGRIRVTIAEGVMRGPAFERLRDVIAFSFQHAPLNILEHSGLAWPNPRAFANGLGLPPQVFSRVLGHEAHAHAAPKPVAQLDDPFVDAQSVLTPLPAQWKLRSGAATTTDESLPDISSNQREQTGSVVSVETSSVVERSRTSTQAKMPMLREPWKKYQQFKPLDLPNRQWPSKINTRPPRWLATDLRDGNQSLVDPMDGEQKLRFFNMLVELGYKEIEVSFPSASQTDYDFTRHLVETEGVVPDDVYLQVLSPCRVELIKRTVDSLRGAKKAILHLYLATSECFRRVVFGLSEEETIELAVKCTKYARSLTKDDPSQAGTEWLYEFSPETFSDTSPEYAVRVCEAVRQAWEPTKESKLIFNLPATVEVSTPNVFADQIEYFCTHMTDRETFCVSVHPHNDRGCAVAAAELAQMAGAERVEGTLFGNGERTGNVDLVTLALNLYTQGIWPEVDFSDINRVIKVVEESNKIPVNERWPYGGQLVVSAFSGSHQDAIKKGFQARKKDGDRADDPWRMPYLPLDPQDIGRTYEAVIRVNSQSGKGGVAWVIQRGLELDLPRGLQVAFSKIVQKEADAKGRELLPQEIQHLFEEAYHLKRNPRFTLIDYNITAVRQPPSSAPERKLSSSSPAQNTSTAKRQFAGVIAIDGIQHPVVGVGNGAISSLANALHSLGIDLDVADYKEHAIGGGRDVKAATYIECTASNWHDKVWGVGIHEDVVQASLIALLSAASSFLTSRVSTPVPFKPKHIRDFSVDEIEALDKLNISTSPESPLAQDTRTTSPLKDSVTAPKPDLHPLERKADEQRNGVNGHA